MESVCVGKTPLSISLFTLHRFPWNPDKHWGCERWRVSKHSSPLFTTLHHSSPYCEARSSLMTGTSHNRWLMLVIIDDRTIVYIMRLKKMMRVKSGEEWWRVSSTLHRHKCLTHKSLHYECEEWRVFLKVAFYASGACKWLKNRDLWAVGQFVRTNSICPYYFFLCLLTLCFPLRNS